MTKQLRQVPKRLPSWIRHLGFLIFPEPLKITKIDQKVTKIVKRTRNDIKM